MRPDLPESFTDLDEACDLFEKAWKSDTPRLEEFLRQSPPEERDAWFHALLEIEVEIRLGRGESPSRDDYVSRFPQQRSTIEKVLHSDIRLFKAALAINDSSVRLIVVSGPHLGREIVFRNRDTFLVGRSSAAHFRLSKKDPYFSRHHFLLEVNPPLCRLVDLKSRNGTRVNGEFIQSAPLRDGDVIHAGSTKIEVLIAEEPTRLVGTVAQPCLPNPPPSDPRLPSHQRPDLVASAETLNKVVSPVPAQHHPAAGGEARTLKIQIPGYEVANRLGTGGMGEVFRALRKSDGHPVAIKIIKPAVAHDSAATKRFLREIRILGQLQHPSIVPLLESGQAGDQLYFVMELVDGVSLDRWVKTQPPLSAATAVALIRPVLTALLYAHSMGYVHRDVKPANILVSTAGPTPTAVLTDFGLARLYEASKLSGLTLLGDACGTPYYMAPEQVTRAREAKPSADQYSLAAVLYWLLTGCRTHAFPRDIQGILLCKLQDNPVPLRTRLPQLSDHIASVIHKALSKQPSERYATIQVFEEELLRAMDQPLSELN